LFGAPDRSETAPEVDVLVIKSMVALPELPWPRRTAATPDTCGQAIDVPLICAVPEFELWLADVMYLPGAKRSTQLP